MARLDRKYCDICSSILPSFGYMHLQDGSICMDCRRKISPFLKGTKDITVERMAHHITYREENKSRLKEFKPAISFGYDKKLYIDPYMPAFLVTANRRDEIASDNPDVISLNDVMNCTTKIKEYSKEEFARDEDGKRVSYFPPQINYYYDFLTIIKLDNEWFDEIVVSLNGQSVEGRGSRMYKQCNIMAKQLKDTLMVENHGFAGNIDGRNNHMFRL